MPVDMDLFLFLKCGYLGGWEPGEVRAEEAGTIRQGEEAECCVILYTGHNLHSENYHFYPDHFYHVYHVQTGHGFHSYVK